MLEETNGSLPEVDDLDWEELIEDLFEFADLYLLSKELNETKERAEEAAETLEQLYSSPSEIDLENFYADVFQAKRNFTVYFLLTNEVIEELVVNIAYSEIVDPNRKSSAVKDTFTNQLNFWNHLELLHDAEIIDDGLKGEITQVRKTRNQMAHGLESAMSELSSRKPTKEIERAERVKDRLEDLTDDDFLGLPNSPDS
ncbi:hypothetical protein [Halostella sp. PRR32]|uniref:hypothetical protein n=1 Tax=Halostella sp. PRR32 TaxID=3098147 RepID=UPI002B1D94C3|nr:hypothetical protein [Halostella sp. PRR32]